MADLKDRIVLVTGASRGVGRGIAEGLAEAGATIYLTARTTSTAEPPAPDSLEATAEAVTALGGTAIPLSVDHTEDEAVLELFRRIESEAGRLDVLVNNAFHVADPSVASISFWERPLEDWDQTSAIGLRGCYVASALAGRLMVEQGSGMIVNLSGCDEPGLASTTAGSVCKAGVDRMAADMSRALEPHGVTALSLAPGPVRTERVLAALDRGQLKISESRLRSPRFVGRAVAALAMDPDIHEKTGGRFEIETLKKEYRFSDLTPDSTGTINQA